MGYHWTGSIVDQYLTEDMANYQISHGYVSMAYFVNVQARHSILHSHPYYECIIVRKGKAEYLVNGQSFSLYPDEMLFITPGVPHIMSCEEGETSYERMILQINAKFLRKVMQDIGMEDKISPTPQFLVFRAEAVHTWHLPELFERIHAASAVEDKRLRELLYHSQLSELVLTLEVIIKFYTPKTPKISNALISNVAVYLQENFRDPKLKVADLAKQFYVSREHLSRTFKEYTGDSLRDYLTNLRMQEFRNGLIRGGTVLSAFRESGFSDYSSFVKSFRKLYGITPVEYREHLLKAMNHLPEETGES